MKLSFVARLAVKVYGEAACVNAYFEHEEGVVSTVPEEAVNAGREIVLGAYKNVVNAME